MQSMKLSHSSTLCGVCLCAQMRVFTFLCIFVRLTHYYLVTCLLHYILFFIDEDEGEKLPA